MHGARIVGQKHAAGGGHLDEFPERGLAGEIRGARRLLRSIMSATDWHNFRSPEEPKTATDPPQERATSSAASAKRSGSQRLAVP